MPFKDFAGGQEALAEDIDLYLMGQTVMRFPTAAARTAAIAAPVKGQFTTRDDNTGGLEVWDGGAWVHNRVLQNFGKAPALTIPVSTNQTYTMNVTAPLTGALMLTASCRFASQTSGNPVTMTASLATSTPAPIFEVPGYVAFATGLATATTTVMGLWYPTRAALINVKVQATNAGGAGGLGIVFDTFRGWCDWSVLNVNPVP